MTYPGFVLCFIHFILFHKQVLGSCPVNCADCSTNGDSEKCDKCNYGYWLREDGYCLPCPDKCEQCTNASQCTKCMSEYWDIRPRINCGSPCPDMCTASGCFDTTGYCAACHPGFFGRYCDLSCDLCIDNSCNFQQCITGCIVGYYVSTYNGYECKKCRDHCSSCVSSINCTQCERGYFLLSYENYDATFCSPCSPQCGECISFSECVCQSGKYGPTCSKDCSIPNCKSCTEFDSFVRCTECTSGYTVMNGFCILETNPCSQYCLNGCDINQNCLSGCQDGWTGQKCSERCAIHCRKCAKNDKNECKICDGDFYTATCTVPCSVYCADLSDLSKCNINNGTCLNGCDNGHWGAKCDKSCYEGCSSDSCNQSYGFCDICNRLQYGDICQYKCSEHCIDNGVSLAVCYKENGTCVHGCRDGYGGNNCENELSVSTMLSSTCVSTMLSSTEKVDGQYDDSDGHDSFAKTFLLGIVAGVGICLLLGLIAFVAVRQIRRIRKQSNGSQTVREERQYENTAVTMQDVNTTVTENVGSNTASGQTSCSMYDSLDVDRRDDQHQYGGLERRTDQYGPNYVNI